jgi:hypothetical protein
MTSPAIAFALKVVAVAFEVSRVWATYFMEAAEGKPRFGCDPLCTFWLGTFDRAVYLWASGFRGAGRPYGRWPRYTVSDLFRITRSILKVQSTECTVPGSADRSSMTWHFRRHPSSSPGHSTSPAWSGGNLRVHVAFFKPRVTQRLLSGFKLPLTRLSSFEGACCTWLPRAFVVMGTFKKLRCRWYLSVTTGQAAGTLTN